MHYSEKRISQNTVQSMIAEYERECRHPDQRSFVISEIITLEEALVEGQAKPGVYLIYTEDKSLAYIGMASQSIAARIRQHMTERERSSKFWTATPAASAQIVVTPSSWEPHSLEEFLIQKAKEEGQTGS